MPVTGQKPTAEVTYFTHLLVPEYQEVSHDRNLVRLNALFEYIQTNLNDEIFF